MLVGWMSEKHSYVWYNTDIHVLNRGISILYDDVCMRNMHRLLEMLH
jgi:hypothetical protein